MNIKETFQKHEDAEFLKFERVVFKISNRPDLHAFVLLDRLVPGTHNIVSAAEHDEIYLGVDPDELAEIANEKHVIDLLRCGVRYDSETDGLAMFT